MTSQPQIVQHMIPPSSFSTVLGIVLGIGTPLLLTCVGAIAYLCGRYRNRPDDQHAQGSHYQVSVALPNGGGAPASTPNLPPRWPHSHPLATLVRGHSSILLAPTAITPNGINVEVPQGSHKVDAETHPLPDSPDAPACVPLESAQTQAAPISANPNIAVTAPTPAASSSSELTLPNTPDVPQVAGDIAGSGE